MIAAVVVAGARLLATGATALAHRSDRRAHATIAIEGRKLDRA